MSQMPIEEYLEKIRTPKTDTPEKLYHTVLEDIAELAYDYDGYYNDINGLRSIIREIFAIAQLGHTGQDWMRNLESVKNIQDTMQRRWESKYTKQGA